MKLLDVQITPELRGVIAVPENASATHQLPAVVMV
ncbi:MAG: hypothetical protein RLZ28_507, partial [Actinomycetota bacterium]